MKNYILGILCIVFFASCSLFSVDKNSDVTNINTTVGEELIDLKKALDSGAITKEEYNDMKQKIVNRNTQ